MIIIWALLILAVIGLLKGACEHGCPTWSGKKEEKGSNANEILKERYAKGEITKEEFDKMKKDLE